MGIKKQSMGKGRTGAQGHYGKVTDDIVALLTEIVSDKNVLTGDDRYDYSRDEMPKSKPVFLGVLYPFMEGLFSPQRR